jgi:hypothetical protein
VDLTLFGVVGFSDILQRTMLTVDAELSSAMAAEKILIQRWKTSVGVKNGKLERSARYKLVQRHLGQLGLPHLPRVIALEAALTKAELLR